MKNIGNIIDNKDISDKKYTDDRTKEWSTGVDGLVKTNTNATKTNIPSEINLAEMSIADSYHGLDFMLKYNTKITSKGIYINENSDTTSVPFSLPTDFSIVVDKGVVTVTNSSQLDISSKHIISLYTSTLQLSGENINVGYGGITTGINLNSKNYIYCRAKYIDLDNTPVIHSGFPVFKGLLGGTFTVNVPKSIGAKPALLKLYSATNTMYPQYGYVLGFGINGVVGDPPIKSIIETSIGENQRLMILTATGASASIAKISLAEAEDTDNYIYTFTIKDNNGDILDPTISGAMNAWDVDMRFIF